MTGQPEMDWQRDLRKGFAGFGEAIARAAALNVDRPDKAGGIGYLSPSSAGWNAYVYQSIGRAKFVGWYDNVDKAARAVDREYGR